MADGRASLPVLELVRVGLGEWCTPAYTPAYKFCRIVDAPGVGTSSCPAASATAKAGVTDTLWQSVSGGALLVVVTIGWGRAGRAARW